jgi:fucose 4-O-acetylase-like acetyltransferase
MDRLFAHNARGLLIILVIFGHLLEQRLQVNDAAGATYIFLHAFHMPAIAFLSGIATRPHNGPAELGNTALKLLQPLIICQLLFLPLEMALAHEGKNWFRYAVTPY